MTAEEFLKKREGNTNAFIPYEKVLEMLKDSEHIFRGGIDQMLLYRIIGKWGVQTQIRKIKEEALELALAITHKDIPTKDQDKVQENIIEEIADMKIMIAQAEIIFGEDVINGVVAEKQKKIQVRFPDLAV